MDWEAQHKEELAWRNALKAGDRVCITGRWNPELATVTAITPTQVVIGHTRYRKRDGRAVGESSTWNSTSISPITKDIEESIEHRKLSNRIGRYAWDKCPIEPLRKIADILDGIKDSTKEPPK